MNESWSLGFSLSAGQVHDAGAGEQLLSRIGRTRGKANLVMDRAYEGQSTRDLARGLGYRPVVPAKVNRLLRWRLDKRLYARRNEVERLFRRLKGFRRVFTRFERPSP